MDDIVGAFDGFCEEVFEFDGGAAAGFDGFAVFAEDGAEPDVFHFVEGVMFGVEPAFDGFEEEFEVILLAAVGDVDHFLDVVNLGVVVGGGEVGGGVVAGAVFFSDDEGVGFFFGIFVRVEDD